MKTLRLNPEDITTAAALLRRGEIVAFPTDTVYGLAIRYDHPKAIEKLVNVKQRPETKPFPLMVSSLSQIEELAELSDRDRKLIRLWMPGDVTFIFKKHGFIQSGYFAQASTIAFRMPNDPYILELISLINTGLLVPSANVSGMPPCLNSDEVLAQFDGEIEAVVLGRSGQNLASTIVDTTQECLKVLRQGRVTLDEIETSLKEST